MSSQPSAINNSRFANVTTVGAMISPAFNRAR
jgi:hypothetical protein